MNKVENAAIKYQLDFEAYKNGYANEVVLLLDKADNSIASYIKKTKGVYTKARYKEIASKLREVSKSLKDKVADSTEVDGIIEYELKKQRKLLGILEKETGNINGVKYDFIYPTVEQAKTSALFKPVTDSMTYDSYLNGIEEGLFNVWDSAVRTGYLTGQSTGEIVRKVMGGVSAESKLKNPGLINSLRNSLYGNTRTLLQSFAAETRNRVYEENEKYFGAGGYKYEWVSALDSRTCLVCGNLDGKLFKTLKEVPAIPVHRGCRCVIVPYFDIDGTRASKDGYVDSKVTFSEWLGEQDEKTQRDVLGAARFKMYQDGAKITQFVDNGRVLTLKQLQEHDI